MQVAPQPRDVKQEDGGEGIGRNHRQDVAVDAPLEDHQIQHVEEDGGGGGEQAVQGVELDVALGPHKLRAQRAQRGHQDKDVDQQGVFAHIGQSGEQRLQ